MDPSHVGILIVPILFFVFLIYLLGTDAFYFVVMFAIFISSYLLIKKFNFSEIFIILVFLLLNIIPINISGHPFEPEIRESIEPKSVGFGWPAVGIKYYLGEGDECPACYEKRPIREGSVKTRPIGAILNIIVLLILVKMTSYQRS